MLPNEKFSRFTFCVASVVTVVLEVAGSISASGTNFRVLHLSEGNGKHLKYCA